VKSCPEGFRWRVELINLTNKKTEEKYTHYTRDPMPVSDMARCADALYSTALCVLLRRCNWTHIGWTGTRQRLWLFTRSAPRNSCIGFFLQRCATCGRSAT
jgi:hypothetical protein